MLVKGIIEQALHERDVESAAAMIDRCMVVRSFDDICELCTLRGWLDRLDDKVLSRYPMLCLYYAQVCSVSAAPELPSGAMLERIDRLLQMADSVWRVEENVARLGAVYAFRAQLEMRAGMYEQMVAYASQALRWLPLESQHWRGVCLNLLGARAITSGQLGQAIALLREALTIWTNLRHPHEARSCLLLLAMVYSELGVWKHASDCYQQVVEEARRVGDWEDLIPALLGWAQILCQGNDVERAERAAQEAWDASEQWQNEELLARATSVLEQIWSLRGSETFVKRPLLKEARVERGVSEQVIEVVEPLSRQEQRVLRLLVAELSYADIARELVVSINTVKTQVSSIYRKLDVHNRWEAQVVARRLQL
jgi:ATP/maltotriose-dependent transcriptional regulator MalT